MKNGLRLQWFVFLLVACEPADVDPGGVPPDATNAVEALPAETLSDPAAICATLKFANPVDRALCPKLQGAGFSPRYADPFAVCRRLAIDFLGRVPTWNEVLSECIGKSPMEVVDLWMTQKEYVELARRRFADRFEYNDGIVYYQYIVALDALVQDLYRGKVTYDEFVVAALVAPAYTMRHFGESRVSRAYQVFLGRDAHGVERSDLQRLWTMWVPQYAVDSDFDYGLEYYEATVYTSFCTPPYDELFCTSHLYGKHTVALDVPNPAQFDDPTNILSVDDLTTEQWEVLKTPGKVLTTLPMFHEHAVTEALNRLVGWDAATRLPEVRQALVEFLVGPAELDIRKVEQVIAASSLYLQVAQPADDVTEPVTGEPARWRYSPRKVMEVETWMDSVQTVTGYSLGRCDPRFAYVRGGYVNNVYHYVDHEYPVMDPNNNAPDMRYADVARLLGGCPDHYESFRYTGTGVVHALDQESFIYQMCLSPLAAGVSPGGAFGPWYVPSFDVASLTTAVGKWTRAAWTREMGPEETAFVESLAQACQNPSPDCDAETVLSHLCISMLKTAEFYHY